MPRAGWAGLYAGRHSISFRQVVVVNAIHAEGALFHDAVALIVFPGAIGTRPRTEFAADAGVGIDQHDSVFGPLVRGPCRADRYAVRFLTVQAGAWKMNCPAAGSVTGFKAVNPVQPCTVGVVAIGVDIGKRRRVSARYSIPCSLRHRRDTRRKYRDL